MKRCSGRDISRGPTWLIAFLVTLAVPATALAMPASGDLDRSFGDEGEVTTNFGDHRCGGDPDCAEDYLRDVVVDAQDRIVAAGVAGTSDPSGDFGLARYKPRGRLDSSFSGNGKVRTDFGGLDGVYTLALDSQERIVAVGPADDDYGLARYLPDGSLDPSFGTGGKLTTTVISWSVAIDSQDRLIVAGNRQRRDFRISRYLPDGTLDPSFSGDGKVATHFPNRVLCCQLAIDSLDRIVARGGLRSDHGTRGVLVRYLPTGTLDSSFSGDGMIITGTKRAYVGSPTIDAQDRIVAVGRAPGGGFGVARYKPDGSLDESFSGNGRVKTSFEDDQAAACSVAIDYRRRIVVGGFVDNEGRLAIARYRRDGDLDHSFSGDGKVKTDFKTFQAGCKMALDSEGRIVAGGDRRVEHRNGSEDSDFVLARFIGY